MEKNEPCIPNLLLDTIKDFFTANPNRTTIIVHAKNAKKNILFVKTPYCTRCFLCNSELTIKTYICNFGCECSINAGYCDKCETKCDVVFIDDI